MDPLPSPANVSDRAWETGNASGLAIQPAQIALGAFLGIFPLLTILGNLLVICAVVKERYLRTVTNYFIVSLACADLLMGSLVMPLAVMMEVTGGYWPFDQTLCDFWHALDVLSSTASIMNLCMIALERYWATENPIAYPNQHSKARCFVMVALVWLLSSAISFPAIIWWRYVTEPSDYQPHRCTFTTDRAYLVISSIVSFYAPLVVMLVVYQRIYKTATDLVRSMNAGAKVIYKNGEHGEKMVLRIHRGNGHLGVPTPLPTRRSPMIPSASSHRLSRPNPAAPGDVVDGLEDELPGACCQDRPADRTGSVSTTAEASTSHRIRSKLRRFALGKRLGKFAREQKAAKTLGIVMGVFIICWLPYFVCNIVITADTSLVSPIVFSLFTWLGYINSCINPMIYAHSMREFRRAFIKLLCCCYIRRRSAGNFRFYQTPCSTAVTLASTLTAQRQRRAARGADRPSSLNVTEHFGGGLPPHMEHRAITPQF